MVFTIPLVCGIGLWLCLDTVRVGLRIRSDNAKFENAATVLIGEGFQVKMLRQPSSWRFRTLNWSSETVYIEEVTLGEKQKEGSHGPMPRSNAVFGALRNIPHEFVLDVSGSDFSGDDAIRLSGSKIVKLDADFTELKDEAMTDLRLDSLQVLEVENTGVGKRFLESVKHLPRLIAIHAKQSFLRSEDADRLKRELPHIHLQHD
jgi:hypothetical protein